MMINTHELLHAIALIEAGAMNYRSDFADKLAENWHIWKRFEAEADKIRARGRAHHAARTIGEYIRHETALRSNDEEFKVNDHLWPDFARLYMNMHPDSAGFFELRERRAA